MAKRATPGVPDHRTMITIEVYQARDGFRWRERRAGRTLRDNYTRRADCHRALRRMFTSIMDGTFQVVDLE